MTSSRALPRRSPAQSRSRALVQAILDGAARVYAAARGGAYDAEGAPDPSINRIAEVAGVSVGSVYQYFPGKRAIVAALAQRRMRDIHERLLEVIEGARGLSVEDAAERLVAEILAMKRRNARVDDAIVRETLRHAVTAEAFAEDAELVARFAGAIASFRPKVRDDVPADVAAHILFHGLRAVMVTGTIARPDLTDEPRLGDELRKLIVGYLRPYRSA